MTNKKLTPQQQMFMEMLKKASMDNIPSMPVPTCVNCKQPLCFCDCPEFVEDKDE